LTDGRFAQPLLRAPSLARALNLGIAGTLVVSLALVTRRAAHSAANDRGLFACWAILSVVLNPLAWTHTVVIALVPTAFLVGIVPSWTLVAAFATLSIPHESLAFLAGAVPVTPLRGLLLSLHTLALLFAFLAALLRMRRPALLARAERINEDGGTG